MTNSNKPEISSPLSSSLMNEARYDPFMQVMTIEFANGTIYEFIEVPKKTYSELVESESAGRYFHSQIRGKFEFLRRT